MGREGARNESQHGPWNQEVLSSYPGPAPGSLEKSLSSEPLGPCLSSGDGDDNAHLPGVVVKIKGINVGKSTRNGKELAQSKC